MASYLIAHTDAMWFRVVRRPQTIPAAETIVRGLPDEIRRSEESRYDPRLHGVLRVTPGMTGPEVGRLRGDARRMVERC